MKRGTRITIEVGVIVAFTMAVGTVLILAADHFIRSALS